MNVVLPEQLILAFNQYCDENGYVRGWVVEHVLRQFLETRETEKVVRAIPHDVMRDLAAFSRAHHGAPVEGLIAKAVQQFIDRETAKDPRTAEAIARAKKKKDPGVRGGE